MPKLAFLECVRCHSHVSAETPQMLCPLCAGPLYVRYDMEALKKTARREEVAARAVAGGASLGLWRYASVLPEVMPVTLGEGWTPMIQSRRYAGLLVKQEGANPTGSVEAREMALAVTMAKHYGLRHLAVSSAGNAAGALAAYAAAAGITAHLFMPQDVPLANYLEGVVYGAEVVTVAGTVSDCERVMAERIEAEKGVSDEAWFDLSTWKEPFRVEGMKTMGYEMVEQLGWTYPDAVFYPAGDGAALIGMWKAFEEMEQLGWVSGRRPKMYALQAGADGGTMLRDIVRQSEGATIDMTQGEMLKSMLGWAKHEGILFSPEGAGAAAAYDRLLANGELKAADRVVLFDTSAGLKFTDKTVEAMHLKRPGILPTSAKVGGIITPV